MWHNGDLGYPTWSPLAPGPPAPRAPEPSGDSTGKCTGRAWEHSTRALSGAASKPAPTPCACTRAIPPLPATGADTKTLRAGSEPRSTAPLAGAGMTPMSTPPATSGTGALTFSPHGRPDKGGGDRRPARRQRGQHESDNEPRRCMALRAPSADKRALTLKTTRRHGPNTESALSSQVYKSHALEKFGAVRADPRKPRSASRIRRDLPATPCSLRTRQRHQRRRSGRRTGR